MTDDLTARLKGAFSALLGNRPEPVKPPATLSDLLKAQPIRQVRSKDIEASDSKSRIQCRFEAFHRANPHVLDTIIDLSRHIASTGRTMGSIAQIFEVMRYSYSIQTVHEDYKLNNSYRAYYSRVAMALVPGLSQDSPFFPSRRQRDTYVIDWKALEVGRGWITSNWVNPVTGPAIGIAGPMKARKRKV